MTIGFAKKYSNQLQAFSLIILFTIATDLHAQIESGKQKDISSPEQATRTIESPAELLVEIAKLNSRTALEVFQALVRSGKIEGAAKVIELLPRSTSGGLGDLGGRFYRFAYSVSKLASIGRIDLALKTAVHIKEPSDRATLLSVLANELYRPRYFQQIAENSLTPNIVEDSLTYLNQISLPEIKFIPADQLKSEKRDFRVSKSIVLSALGKKKEAVVLAKTNWKEFKPLIDNPQSDNTPVYQFAREGALKTLRTLARSLDTHEAKEFSKGIKDFAIRLDFLNCLALTQWRDGQKTEALQTLENLKEYFMSKRNDIEKTKLSNPILLEDTICLMMESSITFLKIGDRRNAEEIAKTISQLMLSETWEGSQRSEAISSVCAKQLAKTLGYNRKAFVIGEPFVLLAYSLDKVEVQLAEGNKKLALETLNRCFENALEAKDNFLVLDVFAAYFVLAGEKKKAAKILGSFTSPDLAMDAEEIEQSIEEIEAIWKQGLNSAQLDDDLIDLYETTKREIDERIRNGSLKNRYDGILEQSVDSLPFLMFYFQEAKNKSGLLKMLEYFVESCKKDVLANNLAYDRSDKLIEFAKMYFELGEKKKSIDVLSWTTDKMKSMLKDKSIERIYGEGVLQDCALSLATRHRIYRLEKNNLQKLHAGVAGADLLQEGVVGAVLKKSFTMQEISLARKILETLTDSSTDDSPE